MLKHLHLFKTLFLLLAIVAGGNAWAEDKTITITSSSLTDYSGTNITYGSYHWTAGDISGVANCAKSTNSGNPLQFNYSSSGSANYRDKEAVYNTVAVPGDIKSIKMTLASGTARKWTPYVSASAITPANYTTSATALSEQTVQTTGTTWNVTASGQRFFYLNYTVGSACYISSIVITYTEADASKVATPTISGDAKFLESTEVSISCGTDGAAIQYSTDNGTNWNDYSAPFTITETTTVKAKATKAELDPSDVASMTFTKVTPMTVAEAKAYIDAGVDLANQYVRGKISKIDSYSSNTITYWISDDGTTTNQMEVYRGKGLNNANFTAITNLEVGDVVVVYGTLMLFNSTIYEFNTGNYLISRTEKPASDLTKKADVTLDFKNGETMASLTDYFTTSSTGAITYTVADGTVIENADEVISALKVGTTTVTVSQAADLNYKAGEITINVTVQDTRVDATTIPAINISTLKADAPDGTISVVNPIKADEGVTFSFTSSNEDVLLIEGTSYIVGEVGIVTVTVTATPSDINLYKPVVKKFNVTVELAVKNDNAINLDATSGSTVYGTKKSVGYELEDAGYDGVVSYTINNAAIADVEVGASAITFTPKAVGTAVITIVAPATATYNEAEPKNYTLTVTAPAGGTEAPASSDTYDKITTISELTDGKYLIVCESEEKVYDGSKDDVTVNNNTDDVTITDDKIERNPSIDAMSFTISAVTGGYSIQSASGYYIGRTASTNGMNTSTTEKYVNTISFADGNAVITSSGGPKLQMWKNSSDSRFRYYASDQNAIQLYKTIEAPVISATLNSEGYATICSEYPLDFTDYETADYSAWQVTAANEGKMTFSQVTGTVKGGTGLLLKGEAGATITLKSSDSSTTLSTNKLEGTLAPKYIAANAYLGLSGKTFVPVKAGTVKAGKALLPVSAIGSSVRELTFEFEDAGTTGINNVNVNHNDNWYDMQGRKVVAPQKGLYIVNGKKVVIK